MNKPEKCMRCNNPDVLHFIGSYDTDDWIIKHVEIWLCSKCANLFNEFKKRIAFHKRTKTVRDRATEEFRKQEKTVQDMMDNEMKKQYKMDMYKMFYGSNPANPNVKVESIRQTKQEGDK